MKDNYKTFLFIIFGCVNQSGVQLELSYFHWTNKIARDMEDPIMIKDKSLYQCALGNCYDLYFHKDKQLAINIWYGQPYHGANGRSYIDSNIIHRPNLNAATLAKPFVMKFVTEQVMLNFVSVHPGNGFEKSFFNRWHLQ